MEVEVTAIFNFQVDDDYFIDPNKIFDDLLGHEVTLDLRQTETHEKYGAPKFVVTFVDDVEVVG